MAADITTVIPDLGHLRDLRQDPRVGAGAVWTRRRIGRSHAGHLGTFFTGAEGPQIITAQTRHLSESNRGKALRPKIRQGVEVEAESQMSLTLQREAGLDRVPCD